MTEKFNIKTAVAVFAIGLAGGMAGYGVTRMFDDKALPAEGNGQDTGNTAPGRLTSQIPTLFSSATPTEFTKAAELCIDGVVHVKTKYRSQNSGYGDPLFQYFFGLPQREAEPAQASGSGVIISNDGYIVTNNHVIENSTEIEVVLNDRRSYEAVLIGRDPLTDIALLKIEADSLTAIPFGSSDNLKVGEWVLAIGNPFNLTSTVTSGIVSAKARNINILDRRGAIESFIQTDAAVNPGNSGGALVNTNGELVGINTAIASQTGSFTGYAFAVPTSIVSKVIVDLKEYGNVQRALIGVGITEITQEIANENNLSKLNGVVVTGVVKNSAADDAGIKEGDIITAINGKPTNTVSILQETVSSFRPGDKATIEFVHKGDKKSSQIIFKNKENEAAISTAKEIEMLGASMKEVNKVQLEDGSQTINGVMVSNITNGGKLHRAGMRNGFIITVVNKQKVSSPADIQKMLNNYHGGVYMEGYYPNGEMYYYAFGI